LEETGGKFLFVGKSLEKSGICLNSFRIFLPRNQWEKWAYFKIFNEENYSLPPVPEP